ncbi:MAG: hypothetical protein N4A33_12405 [Bacteriovoracaceae bacterium]|jgi:hypothetical protein|nr:hypothetical protein [Bacteriovoracaceae bacterium]
MRLFKIGILTVFIYLSSFASKASDNGSGFISDFFDGGSILAYDCKLANTVCTDKRSIEFCNEFKDSKCQIIKAFASQSECNKYQLKLVSKGYTGMSCN